jgi:hypothetical protein
MRHHGGIMIFTKEFLQALVTDDQEGADVIINELVDTSRWSVHYRMVFKFEDKFYQTFYSCGATETQDESPYEYDGAQIECKEVFATEKVITVYE